MMRGLFSGRAAGLRAGMPAPPVELPDQYGRLRRLSDYRGKWVVLYFYPKDDTPGCTVEACHFRDGMEQLRALGMEVLGVSLDNEQSHARFAEKYDLPFTLLADIGGKVARSYGSLLSLGPLQVAKRHTFLIDDQGRVAKVYRRVKPRVHGEEIFADLRLLRQSA